MPKISDGQQLFVLNGLSKLSAVYFDAIVRLSINQFMNTGIGTYIWLISKNKPAYRAGKVQLIDATHCFESRRRPIGKKRNDITDLCCQLITRAYGEYSDKRYGDDDVFCTSRIYGTEEFGFNKVVVERPTLDESGEIVRDKKGKPIADSNLRETENIPLTEDIDAYFEREIRPYAPNAWIDKKKTKVGYEIPMTRYFYEFPEFNSRENIQSLLEKMEAEINASMKRLFEE